MKEKPAKYLLTTIFSTLLLFPLFLSEIAFKNEWDCVNQMIFNQEILSILLQQDESECLDTLPDPTVLFRSIETYMTEDDFSNFDYSTLSSLKSFSGEQRHSKEETNLKVGDDYHNNLYDLINLNYLDHIPDGEQILEQTVLMDIQENNLKLKQNDMKETEEKKNPEEDENGDESNEINAFRVRKLESDDGLRQNEEVKIDQPVDSVEYFSMSEKGYMLKIQNEGINITKSFNDCDNETDFDVSIEYLKKVKINEDESEFGSLDGGFDEFMVDQNDELIGFQNKDKKPKIDKKVKNDQKLNKIVKEEIEKMKKELGLKIKEKKMDLEKELKGKIEKMNEKIKKSDEIGSKAHFFKVKVPFVKIRKNPKSFISSKTLSKSAKMNKNIENEHFPPQKGILDDISSSFSQTITQTVGPIFRKKGKKGFKKTFIKNQPKIIQESHIIVNNKPETNAIFIAHSKPNNIQNFVKTIIKKSSKEEPKKEKEQHEIKPEEISFNKISGKMSSSRNNVKGMTNFAKTILKKSPKEEILNIIEKEENNQKNDQENIQNDEVKIQNPEKVNEEKNEIEDKKIENIEKNDKNDDLTNENPEIENSLKNDINNDEITNPEIDQKKVEKEEKEQEIEQNEVTSSIDQNDIKSEQNDIKDNNLSTDNDNDKSEKVELGNTSNDMQSNNEDLITDGENEEIKSEDSQKKEEKTVNPENKNPKKEEGDDKHQLSSLADKISIEYDPEKFIFPTKKPIILTDKDVFSLDSKKSKNHKIETGYRQKKTIFALQSYNKRMLSASTQSRIEILTKIFKSFPLLHKCVQKGLEFCKPNSQKLVDACEHKSKSSNCQYEQFKAVLKCENDEELINNACYKECPKGFTNYRTLCLKPNYHQREIKRNVSRVKDEAKENWGQKIRVVDCEKVNENMRSVGPYFCKMVCPLGFKDHGIYCERPVRYLNQPVFYFDENTIKK